MRRRPKHPETGMTYACPECESSQFQGRTRRRPRFKCQECSHEFGEPDERETMTGLTTDTTAAVLFDMDPEDAGLSPKGERA